MEWLLGALLVLLLLRVLLGIYGERFFARVIPSDVQSDPKKASRWFFLSIMGLLLFALALALLSRPERPIEWFFALLPVGIILGFIVYAFFTGKLPRRFK